MTDRRIPRSRVARTVEGPPTRPKERTTQTHPAHRTGSLQDTPTDGRWTNGQRLTTNRASELDTELDHDADPEHVHEPEPVLMIGHRHTPAPAQQGALTGAAGGRLDCTLALGQRRARAPDLDIEMDHDSDLEHVHHPEPAHVIGHGREADVRGHRREVSTRNNGTIKETKKGTRRDRPTTDDTHNTPQETWRSH